MNFVMYSYKNSVVVKKFHDNENKTLCLAQKRFSPGVPSRSWSWQSKRVEKKSIRSRESVSKKQTPDSESGVDVKKNWEAEVGVRKTGTPESELGVEVKKINVP